MALASLANTLSLQGGRTTINPAVRNRASRVGLATVTRAHTPKRTLPKTAGSHRGGVAGTTTVTRSAKRFRNGHAVGPARFNGAGAAVVPNRTPGAIATLPRNAGTNLLRVAGTTAVTKSAKTKHHKLAKGTKAVAKAKKKHHKKAVTTTTTTSSLTSTDYLVLAVGAVAVWYFFFRK